MRRLIAVFIYFLPVTAIVFHGCTYQGPVKKIVTEKRIIRANTYMQEGKYKDAVADYTKALQVNPLDATAYNNRGLAWERKGNYDKAIADFTKAVEINPQYADAYKSRGVAYYDKGDYDSAIADYSKAVEINPRDASAYNNRGVAWYGKEDYGRTCSDFQISCGLGNCKGLDWARKEGLCNQ
jgi:tetratricopeptide (TPR) repeat protein